MKQAYSSNDYLNGDHIDEPGAKGTTVIKIVRSLLAAEMPLFSRRASKPLRSLLSDGQQEGFLRQRLGHVQRWPRAWYVQETATRPARVQGSE